MALGIGSIFSPRRIKPEYVLPEWHRSGADAKGSYQVTVSLPVDVTGVYVLVPNLADIKLVL